MDYVLSLSCRLFFLSLFLSGAPQVLGRLHNVSVDHCDERINYSRGWTESGTSNTKLFYGGHYHFTNVSGAFAELKFTGVGIYYQSPLWPFLASARLTLDGSLLQQADLQNHTDTRSINDEDDIETLTTSIAWGVGGLANGTHTLRLEHGGKGGFLLLDGFIYTTAEPDYPPNDQPHSPASPSTAIYNAEKSPTSTSSDGGSNSTPIVIGAVIGVVLGMAGIVIGALLVRYRKPLISRYGRFIGMSDEHSLPRYFPPSSSPPAPPSPAAKSGCSSESVATTHADRGTQFNPTTTTLAASSDISKPKYGLRTLSIDYWRRKSLPPVPPLPNTFPGSTTSLRKKLSRMGSSRQNAGPPPPVDTSATGLKKNTSVKSATSSFFPAEAAPGSVYIPSDNERTKSPTIGVSESSRDYPDHVQDLLPRNYSMTSMRTTNRKQSHSSVSPSTSSDTPVSSSPEILGKEYTFPRRETIKSAKSLFAIVEDPNPEQAGDGSALRLAQRSASASATAVRRKSFGRLRVEKEKWRRRKLPAIPLSPQGPRAQSVRSSRPSFSLSAYTRSPTAEGNNSEPSLSPSSANSHSTARQSRPLPPSPASPPVSNGQWQGPETPNGLPSYAQSVASKKTVAEVSVLPSPPSTVSLSYPRPESTHSIETLPGSDDGLSLDHESTSADVTPHKLEYPRGSIISQPQAERVIFFARDLRSASPSAVSYPLPALLITEPTAHSPMSSFSSASSSRPEKDSLSVSSEPTPRPNRDAKSRSIVSENARRRHVKQKSDASVTFSTESDSHVPPFSLRLPPRFVHSKTADSIPLRRVKETIESDFRIPPRSVPATPSEHSWYAKSNPPSFMTAKHEKLQVAEGTLMQLTGTDASKTERVSAASIPPSLPVTQPLSISHTAKGIRRKPPPALFVSSAGSGSNEESQAAQVSKNMEASSSFPLPPPSPTPHTPVPDVPPTVQSLSPRPSARRRGKVWDEQGRKAQRGSSLSPSPLAKTFLLNQDPS
ncbi:hypothetical protein VNI00_012346 [Paramarasmius palmivorus]|uniref:Transmembrane protein n=1 Tax=Paramarasmius palmivorus TaxID=297713 RepID=A0AAW0C8K3_9AGAR